MKGAPRTFSMRSAILAGAQQGLSPVIWMMATPLLLRGLGHEAYGIWMTINGLLGFGGVLQLGMADAVTSYVSRHLANNARRPASRVVSTSLALYAAIGIVGAAILLLISEPLSTSLSGSDHRLAHDVKSAMAYAALIFLVRQILNVVESALQGMERHDIVSYGTVVSQGATYLLAAAAVRMGALLPDVLLIQFALHVINCVLLLGFVGRQLGSPLVTRRMLDIPVLKAMWSYSAFSWVRTALGVVQSNADRVAIGLFIGPDMVAAYSIALRLAQIAQSVFGKAGSVLFPAVSRVVRQDGLNSARLRNMYTRASSILTVASAAVLLPMTVLADSFFTLWLGQEGTPTTMEVFPILVARYAIQPFDIVSYYYLLGLGQVRYLAILGLLSSSLVIGTMSVFLPAFGVVGVAASRLAGTPLVLVSRYRVEKLVFGRMRVGTAVVHAVPLVGTLVIGLWVGSRDFLHIDGWGELLLVGLGLAIATVVSCAILSYALGGLVKALHLECGTLHEPN